MGAMAILIGCVLLGLVGAVAMVWGSIRLWRRGREVPLLVRAAAATLAALAGSAVLGTVIGLVMALSAVGGESVDPSEKARSLAEGIAAVMNWTALGLLILVPGGIILLSATRKRRGKAE
jgi:hypothetical protein